MDPALEQLVLDFYKPQDPQAFQNLSAISFQLQQVTESPQGWLFAASLLESPHKDARFHGALVFAIKLNQEGSATPPEQLTEIRDHLVAAFVRLVLHGEEYRNVQKLSAALVALFTVPGVQWDHCVHHFMWSLSSGLPVPYAEAANAPPMAQLQLASLPLAALTVFANTLAQDVNKINHASARSAHIPGRLRRNYEAISAIIERGLSLAECMPPDPSNTMLRNHGSRAMECFSSWITYAKAQLASHDEFYQSLQNRTSAAFRLLFHASLFNTVTVFFADVMTSHPGFLLPDQVSAFGSLLQSDWAVPHVQTLEYRDHLSEDSVSFTVLAFAFGQYMVQSLVKESTDAERYMELLHRLTAAQTIQTVEEEMSNDVVDFWEEYVVAVEDSSSPDFARRHWLQAVENLCLTSSLPFADDDDHEFETFAMDDPFSDYRSRISNLLEDSFENLGPVVMKKIISTALSKREEALNGSTSGSRPGSGAGTTIRDTTSPQGPRTNVAELPLAVRQRLWSVLESTLRNLHQMSHAREYRDEDRDEDGVLHQLFNSALFSDLLDMSIDMPRKLHVIAFQLIGSYSDYFGNHGDMMLTALQTLFRHLPEAAYSMSAARAIHLLCDKNRARLTAQIGDFMDFSAQFMAKPQQPDTITRVLGADAAIVQALPDEQKPSHLAQLLQFVSQLYLSSTEIPDELSPTAQAFLYLTEIAESSLAPRNTPIELDGSDASTNFWSEGRGREFHATALASVKDLLAAAPLDGTALDNACQFLRTGLTEVRPGPFVFSPSDIAPLLTHISIDNPRYDVIFHLASSMTDRKRWQPNDTSREMLLDLASRAITHFRLPSAEPDLAFRILQFLAVIAERSLTILLQTAQPNLELYLTYALSALSSAEPLPKREACRLWSALIKADARDAPQQEQSTQIIRLVGGTLTAELLTNIATTSKSELEHFTEPLHKLVRSMPQSRSWMQAAIAADTFPGERASEAAKAAFVRMFAQAQLTKQQRLQFAREFWSACRGVPITYG